MVVLLPRGAGTDCHRSEMARKLVTSLLHTQHTKDYTAVEAERDRSGVRGAEAFTHALTVVPLPAPSFARRRSERNFEYAP